MAQPPQFEGQLAAAAVVAELGQESVERKQIHVPIDLIVRQTTAAI